MLRFTDGFDLCTYPQCSLKYAGYAASFNQGFVTGGRGGGQALEILNTGFGDTNYVAVLGTQAVYGFHADVMISGPSFPAIDFFRFSHPTGTVLSLRLTPAGNIQLISGGTLLIDTTAVALSRNTWYTLEVKATFGTAGAVELRIDQVTRAHANTWNFGALLPDRLTFRWQAFGPPSLVIDNFVIYDGQPGTITTFLGPVRVTPLRAIADDSAGWTPSTGAACYAMINDTVPRTGGSPDGDLTYISPSTSADQVFQMEASPCFGRVMGLTVNVCTRPLGGDRVLDVVATLAGVRRLLETIHITPVTGLNPDMGSALAHYFTYQTVKEQNPATADTWVDAAISGGSWGVGGNGVDVLVTAFYLEKVTSLIPQPYDCGGGNYAY